MFFPPSDRDSLAAFDTLGFVAAQDHTYMRMSLFDADYNPSIHRAGGSIAYAPFVQMSYAYVYILGAETSKSIPALMYLFFVIAFYGILRRNTGKTVAALSTLFMMMAPEMLAFSSLFSQDWVSLIPPVGYAAVTTTNCMLARYCWAPICGVETRVSYSSAQLV